MSVVFRNLRGCVRKALRTATAPIDVCRRVRKKSNIDGCSFTEYECHGNVVDVRDSTNIAIHACDINGCGAIGVFVRNSAGVVVEGCHVHRNTFNAFYLHGCRGVRIQQNVVEHNANFIQAYDVNDLQMSHNVIHDNGGYWDASVRHEESVLPGVSHIESSRPSLAAHP